VKKIVIMLCMLAMAIAMPAQSVQKEQKEMPDWMQELKERITLNGYAQGGYSYQNQTDATNSERRATNDFNLKRTLLWAKARITDRWSFLFMHDFSSVVQEFYTDFRVTNNKAMTVRVGQFKNSLTMENPLSPVVLELVDVCSQAVTAYSGCYDPLYGLNYGRDMGLKIYGELFNSVLLYELAVMNGQGINVRDGNHQKDVIAKFDVRPVSGLRLVASGQLGTGHAVNDRQIAWNPTIVKGDNYKRNRYSVGAEYKFGHYGEAKYKDARPVSVRGEWLEGQDGDVKSRGAYVTACVPVYDALDVIASADWFDRNRSMKYDQTNLTAGVQYWFYKNCRVQLQYTRIWRQFDCNYHNVQAQLQVAF